jgi:glycosyltransferase involved in cell wall biosynthesis
MNTIEFNNDVSFLVKTFNRPSHLYRLLNSISKYYPNIKTIVLDDGNLQLDVKKYKDVELHKIPFNQGIAYGRNLLCQLADTKYVISLDDDFIVCEKSNFYKLYELITTTNYDLIGGTVYDKEKGERHFEGTIFFKDHELHILPIEYKNELERCDIVHNFFIAKLLPLKSISWDNNLKINEHIDFFIQAKGKMNIAYYKESYILHDRIPIDEQYMKYRNKVEPYNQYFANKYNVNTLYLFGSCRTLKSTNKWR